MKTNFPRNVKSIIVANKPKQFYCGEHGQFNSEEEWNRHIRFIHNYPMKEVVINIIEDPYCEL